MFRYELRKLLNDSFGLFFAAAAVILQIIILSFLYPNPEYPNMTVKAHYEEYMSVMSGKLTPEKEQFILAQQSEIYNAQSEMKALSDSLLYGLITDENEYISRVMSLEPTLKKADAFSAVFGKYRYAAKAPEKRYIAESCPGLGRDFPDIPPVIFAALISAIFFLREENSKMITLIRTYKNGNIFRSKITALFMLIIAVSIICSAGEFIFLVRSVGKPALFYPIQSMEIFGGCEYDISIMSGFALMQIMKICGYIFISLSAVFISVTVKKPLPAAAVPLAVCLLGQFAFSEKGTAYYLPTGFLRAAAFFGGNNGGGEFSRVPFRACVFSAAAIIFIAVTTLLSGKKYYTGKGFFLKFKVIPFIILPLFIFAGCGKDENIHVDYNMKNSAAFLQSSEYYFAAKTLNNKQEIYAVTKADGSKFPVIRTPFNDDFHPAAKCVVNDDLYFMQSDGLKGFDIYKISLKTFDLEKSAGQSGHCGYSFLDLKYSDSITFDKYVLNFFTDGETLYLITSDYEIYSCGFDLRSAECIVSDGIFNGELAFDGRNIYYINSVLEFKKYDTQTGAEEKIAEGFVRSFAVHGGSIVYSNKEGIFKIDPAGETRKLSDKKAAAISYDGETAVFSCEHKLYCIKGNTEKEIYSGDLICFSCINGTDKVICSRYDYDTKRDVGFILTAAKEVLI